MHSPEARHARQNNDRVLLLSVVRAGKPPSDRGREGNPQGDGWWYGSRLPLLPYIAIPGRRMREGSMHRPGEGIN